MLKADRKNDVAAMPISQNKDRDNWNDTPFFSTGHSVILVLLRVLHGRNVSHPNDSRHLIV
jgi:hypothetical protein